MDSNISYLRLRWMLGSMGFCLPIILIIFNDFTLKASISHYYYSSASIFFTSFLVAFGLFLVSYSGRKGDNVTVSDNWVTHFGGAMAIITALIPTRYGDQYADMSTVKAGLTGMCEGNGLATQFIHNYQSLQIIHLTCAALFLINMGFMAFFRFTKGNTSKAKKVFYRTCAIMVWAPIVFLGAEMIFKFSFSDYDIFFGEWIALAFFGLAWFVKGKALAKFGM